MAWYDDIANTTKGNVQGLINALRNPQDIVKQGALYKNKDALAALLLHGDTAPIMAKINEKSPANPMEALDAAMMLGTIKGVGQAPLSALEQNILNENGKYALQRFQKAKSLIPDLEKQYTPEALMPLFTTKTERNALTVMKPSEFKNFATPLDESYTNSPQFASKIENLQNVANETGFNEVPFLHLNKYEDSPSITGHEGRHRTAALTQNGDNPTLVEILPRYSIYEKVNPDFNMNQKQFIKALNKEMSFNPEIRPQPEWINDAETQRNKLKFPNELFGLGALPFVDYNKKK